MNRFFVAEGDGDDVPKVEFAENQKQDTSKDLFEESLDDALCVFKSGGTNTDILKENEKQVLFFLDLDNEAIVDRATASKKAEEVDAEEEIQSKMHPLLFNQYPLCKGHSLFLLFAEEGLPQVLSDELLLMILQLFKMSERPSLRIGYNSMGADCITNNLHFHLLNADSLFDGKEVFPIETADKKLFFKTDLKHKSADEINMYNCGVRFGEVFNWPLKALLISPDIADESTSLEDAQEALAHAVGVVVNYLIDQNMPHNMLIADEGMTVFLIPRKFDMLIENVSFFTSFETLCGFIKFKNEQAYGNATWSSVDQQLKENVSLSDDEFTQLKEALVAKFLSEYSGEKINE